MIIAGIGIQFTARRLGRFCARALRSPAIKVYARSATAALVIISAFWSAVTAAPHYRLYMSVLGGGPDRAGKYFPQDEFYDAYMQDAMTEIARRARPDARVVSELPLLASYYAQRTNRTDLVCVDLTSDLAKLVPGDLFIDARGRTYLSNQAMLARLRQSSQPAFTIAVGTTPAAFVYILDQKSLAALRDER
jgi:hypothetical protein